MSRTYVATTWDGGQVLVIVPDTGLPHVATRPDSWSTWSAPLAVEARP